MAKKRNRKLKQENANLKNNSQKISKKNKKTEWKKLRTYQAQNEHFKTVKTNRKNNKPSVGPPPKRNKINN